MHEAPEYTRVVFDVSATAHYELFTLDNPARVVIDFSDTSATSAFDPSLLAVGRKRVRKVRGSARGDDYRVVLDVKGVVDPKSFTLEPVAPYGHPIRKKPANPPSCRNRRVNGTW
jgi:N-acetylmuramoyl-L-alanine amidase